MTLKLKITTNELWKGWNLAWYHNFIHIACAKNLIWLQKNWMHFLFKLDNLFQSERVLDENSSNTKGFHFLSYFNCRPIMRLICTIQSHIIIFQPFSEFISFFHGFNDCFVLHDPEIEKHYKWTLKRMKLGMVS